MCPFFRTICSESSFYHDLECIILLTGRKLSVKLGLNFKFYNIGTVAVIHKTIKFDKVIQRACNFNTRSLNETQLP